MSSALRSRLVPAYWWRAIFFVAASVVVSLACMPTAPDIVPVMNDKLAHFGAFAVLTLLALLAFPEARPLTLLIGLAGLGLGIELLQATPVIDRTPEGMDLLADIGAIVSILVLSKITRSFAAVLAKER